MNCSNSANTVLCPLAAPSLTVTSPPKSRDPDWADTLSRWLPALLIGIPLALNIGILLAVTPLTPTPGSAENSHSQDLPTGPDPVH